MADYHGRFAPDLLERELERRCQEPAGQDQEKLNCLKKCVAAAAGLADNLSMLNARFDGLD